MSSRLPSLKPEELLRAPLKTGFYVHHQKGSHAQLRHAADPAKRVTVPIHKGFDIPRGTLRAILKQADLTPEDFIRYL